MMEDASSIGFRIRDCALAAIATGRRAQNLREFRDILYDVHPESIYYHFWGGLLRPRFVDREYNNDFAGWARHSLHDKVLSERLAVVDPNDFPDIENLRQELLDVIEERLDENEHVPWTKSDQRFEFIRSQIVVFDTGVTLAKPEDLATVADQLSPASIFYHFIDARRRTGDGDDDFRAWLGGYRPAYDELCDQLAGVEPYFQSLTELGQQIAGIFKAYFGREAQ